jgi:inorganic pyrophosphatase
VPDRDPVYAQVRDPADLSGPLFDEIEHFFDVYKMLEPDKSTTTRRYEGAAARREIASARARYRAAPA